MQRFELCFELAWKSLKLAISEWEGLNSASPRQALEHAYALHWLEHEAPWLADAAGQEPELAHLPRGARS